VRKFKEVRDILAVMSACERKEKGVYLYMRRGKLAVADC